MIIGKFRDFTIYEEPWIGNKCYAVLFIHHYWLNKKGEPSKIGALSFDCTEELFSDLEEVELALSKFYKINAHISRTRKEIIL